MYNLEFFNNIIEPICIFSNDNKIIFKNLSFISTFTEFKSIEKFKKRFEFDFNLLCYLSFANIKDKTPIDFLLQSKENFHTICIYKNKNDEDIIYYVYTFKYNDFKAIVFKDITVNKKFSSLEKNYIDLRLSYKNIKEETQKFEKLKENAQAQVMKMGVINRISLVIRETNDINTILSLALKEIHNLLGAFKTYFSVKDKNAFKIRYTVTNDVEINTVTEYEQDVIDSIKNKKITVSVCLKEYINSNKLLHKGVKRIIIPIYDKTKLLGIIVTFTKQRFNEIENKEVLQSIALQLAGAIIQADLIHKLDKQNKKLAKTLNELKDTQMQLINTEKMASIGQLAAGVAHEINTPLASINSNSGIINKIINLGENALTTRYSMLKELNSINMEATKRISDIVKSLKRFVRLDEAEFQEANINNEIDLTLKIVGAEVKKNTKIIKNYQQLPPVKCYVNMLNQVFMNLIVNACHSISSDKKNGIIEISTFYDNKYLTVKIKDNGCGISLLNKNKIFKEGFTTKKVGIGNGLGLSISKKIIEMHKGTISFTSKENEGSEFVVTIPIN